MRVESELGLQLTTATPASSDLPPLYDAGAAPLPLAACWAIWVVISAGLWSGIVVLIGFLTH